ncbi:MAG: hypothetical protein A2161_05500 [Candidatus Schekmanbacteria bacterium RBG_13_48_7]|uniref:Glycosyl transferase family 1 domain-containing protein n=1 Tax=Candidatus Schekmanbacteria bacterium RBG_13_48_7 TaxID=1817878 RepID=A0A1F7S4K7_9BACT|nr:MAG: hypothetical protein A2161_05500 [Candidatus Schekmanbacteria bacterium RBG_13_48_7]
MFYHNITPHEFFINIHSHLVRQIVYGRKELQKYVSLFSSAIADSEYNKSELEKYGYTNVVYFPIKPVLENFNSENTSSLRKLLQDGKQNILFVGRVTPNKGHADLIKSFYFLNKSGFRNTRLIMVGEYAGFEKYYWWLQDLCSKLKLDNVLFPGLVDYDDLIDYYRAADLFVCLSQHEGFCVPLVEAMYFRIPVIALGKTAVPDTMKNAGLVITEIDYWKIAELMGIMLEDSELRDRVLKKQDEVYRYYQSFDLDSNLKIHLKPYLK